MKHDVQFDPSVLPQVSDYRPPGKLALGLTVLAVLILVACGAYVWHLGGIPFRLVKTNIEMKAQDGNAHALYRLALYHMPDGTEPDPAKALGYFLAAAEQGHLESQYGAATLLYHGPTGVRQDIPEAMKWIRKAADGGHAYAQALLAAEYEKGECLPKDDGEATRLYRLAADNGIAAAAYNFANRCRFGQGVTEDPALVVKYLRLAADRGVRDAKLKLALCYRDGYGVERSAIEARRLQEEANHQADVAHDAQP